MRDPPYLCNMHTSNATAAKSAKHKDAKMTIICYWLLSTACSEEAFSPGCSLYTWRGRCTYLSLGFLCGSGLIEVRDKGWGVNSKRGWGGQNKATLHCLKAIFTFAKSRWPETVSTWPSCHHKKGEGHCLGDGRGLKNPTKNNAKNWA